ncbi:MAG TPA: transglycosylase family protein [Candidatus Dormibacteraeota bacterium]|nr:transglycosylase family protein [Candidatus Dormibacteraeota bacterium]
MTHPVAHTNVVAASRSQPRAVAIAEPDLHDPRTDTPTLSGPPPPPPAPPVARPAATPRPRVAVSSGPPASPSSVIGIIEAAAARWGVSGSWMVSIARCESGLRTNAVNPSGPYLGLFQFLQSTFTANGGTNIWSAADQSNIAAKMLAHGQAHQWSCA